MTGNSQVNEISADKRKRKARKSCLIISVLLAFCGVYNPSLAVADESARPFSATFTALPLGGIVVAGGGVATHLGNFDLEVIRQAASIPSPSDPCVGFQFMIATLTAANGDELWMDYTDGEICFDFTDFPIVSFVGDVHLVGTGGTGRFTNSTGDYQMYWNGEISPDGVVNGGDIEGVIDY